MATHQQVAAAGAGDVFDDEPNQQPTSGRGSYVEVGSVGGGNLWGRYRSWILLTGVLGLIVLALVVLEIWTLENEPSGDGGLPFVSKHVIMVSIDGFRWDYLQKYNAPNLAKLASGGLYAGSLRPVFPSLTFPNHYTLATGLFPESHGIVANSMFDPTTGKNFSMTTSSVRESMWWGGDPIWVTSEKWGKKAGVAFWPGSEAVIQGKQASYWLPYNGSQPDTFSIGKLLQWLDLPASRRPTLLMGYMSQVDHAGHDFGPDTPQVANAVQAADTIIGTLVSGLSARGLLGQVDLVVVSDHGMTAISPSRAVYLDDYVDMSLFRVVDWSPVTSILPKAGQEQIVYNALHGKHPNFTVYWRQDIPARFRYVANSRIMPIIGIADEGWSVTARKGGYPITKKGTHGYDNQLPSMGGLFIANGPGFKPAKIPVLDNFAVYNLLCWRLRIQAAANNGSLDAVLPFLNSP